jgi:hypothetical protein
MSRRVNFSGDELFLKNDRTRDVDLVGVRFSFERLWGGFVEV